MAGELVGTSLAVSPIEAPADPNVEGVGSGMEGAANSLIGSTTGAKNYKEQDISRTPVDIFHHHYIGWGIQNPDFDQQQSPFVKLADYENADFDNLLTLQFANVGAADGEVYQTLVGAINRTGADVVIDDFLFGELDSTLVIPNIRLHYEETGINGSDPVFSWLDSSGNGNSMQVEGVDDINMVANFDSPAGIECVEQQTGDCYFTVAVGAATPDQSFGLVFQANLSGTSDFIARPVTGNTFSFISDAGNLFSCRPASGSGAGTIANDGNFHTLIYNYSNTNGTGTYEAFLDGISFDSGTHTESASLGFGHFWATTSGGDPSQAGGHICEFIYFNNDVLSGLQVAGLQDYLSTKWGT